MFWLGRDLRTGSENNCLGLLRPVYVATTGHWLRNPFSFYSSGSVFVVLGNGSWAKLVAMANSPAPDLIFLRVANVMAQPFLKAFGLRLPTLDFSGRVFL